MSSYVPPQHGAWAFLGLPLALGVVVAPWTPLLVILAIAWVAAYPLSYAALGLARARHSRRFRRPLLVWSVVVLPAVFLLLYWRPWLVWVGVGYATLFSVNLIYARHNDERALANDSVFVAECAAMVAVTWAVGAGSQSWVPPGLEQVPAHVWVLVVTCALVLAGSTLHVKSLIRERRDPRYARVSRAFALACVPASLVLGAWWGWPDGAWLVVPFAVLAVRALVVPRRALRPGLVGMVELGCFLIVLVAAILAAV